MRPHEMLRTLQGELCSPPFFVREGCALSARDSKTVSEVYLQWVLLLFDLEYLTPGCDRRTVHRLWTDLSKADVLHVGHAFSECLMMVYHQDSQGFKGTCARVSTHLFPIIRKDVLAVPQGDVFAARRLIQLFSYTSRLTLQDIDLTQVLLGDYLARESSLSYDVNHPHLPKINKILRRWLGSHTPGELVPRHGPGAVAEAGRCSLEEKYRLLGNDARLEYAFGTLSSGARNFDRCSKTIFVPKSYKAFRTISMEPATLQYYQQAVWRLIDQQVRASRFLCSHIGFSDQERNQRLALSGSLQRNYATIDLSAASDSVSYALVKECFRGTWLPRYFLATRSTDTLLPDGTRISLQKFAPMGSALCFPIETLLFAAICECVAQEHCVAGDFSVYGDDIIVPTAIAEDVIATLVALGFDVNRSKSFTDPQCWFRESCGAEYCDGFDVSPMRVSRKYASQDNNVRFQKWIDSANSAYTRGFRHLRQFFIDKIRKQRIVARFAPDSLLSGSYSNFHAKRRWNRGLQRLEILSHRTVTRMKDDADESIRYSYWLDHGRRSLGSLPHVRHLYAQQPERGNRRCPGGGRCLQGGKLQLQPIPRMHRSKHQSRSARVASRLLHLPAEVTARSPESLLPLRILAPFAP